MKRKGLFFSVLVIMVIAMISASISACENEKNDGGGNSGVAYMDFIEGTWTGGEEKVTYTFGFNKDGTGTYVCNSQSSGNQTYTGTLTYSMTTNNRTESCREPNRQQQPYQRSYPDAGQRLR